MVYVYRKKPSAVLSSAEDKLVLNKLKKSLRYTYGNLATEPIFSSDVSAIRKYKKSV